MIADVCSLDMTPGLESVDRHWPIKGLILPKCDGSNDMTIPTREEINVYDSLDERAACERFLGKNLAEAEALFRENSLYHQESLMWMGPVAFRYYVSAIINYIKGSHAAGDADVINCFAGLLEFRLEHESVELVPIARQLASASKYIVDNYIRFGITSDTYGDLRARFITLHDTFTRLTSSEQS